MLSYFVNPMAMWYPMAEIIPASFDPVVGPVARMAMVDGEERLSTKAFVRLRELYPEYLTRWPEVPRLPTRPCLTELGSYTRL